MFSPTVGKTSGGGHVNSLQYSCLENPRDRGAWWATVHGVRKSRARLKGLGIHATKAARRTWFSPGSCCSFLFLPVFGVDSNNFFSK